MEALLLFLVFLRPAAAAGVARMLRPEIREGPAEDATVRELLQAETLPLLLPLRETTAGKAAVLLWAAAAEAQAQSGATKPATMPATEVGALLPRLLAPQSPTLAEGVQVDG
jgi:hypothetical protein